MIGAETAITALPHAEETLSEGSLIAVVLKGLPESHKAFSIHTTQRGEKITFAASAVLPGGLRLGRWTKAAGAYGRHRRHIVHPDLHENATTADIKVYDRLFDLNTAHEEKVDVDECHGCFDIKTWHEILRCSNCDDVLKLQNVTEGLTIKGRIATSKMVQIYFSIY